jgi:integrase
VSDKRKQRENRGIQVGDLVSIHQRSTVWYANWTLEGKQHRRSLKTSSKKQAQLEASKLETEILQGLHRPHQKAASIAEVIMAYQQRLDTEGKAPKTRSKVALVARRVADLAERRGAKTIADINLRFIDAYQQERAEAKAEPKTRQNETVIIRQIVNFARSRQMVARDPLKGLKIRKVKSKPQPFWKRETVDQILGAAKTHHGISLRILADTGMRVGELKWLTWDDIDFENSLIWIRAKDGWRPKTGDHRRIPICGNLHDLLRSLPRVSNWVVTSRPSHAYPEGKHPISERRLLQYLKRVLKKLELKGHLHTFRHSFISHALASGIPEVLVREWVGHVDSETIKLYTHVASDSSMAAMQRLGGINQSLQLEATKNERSDGSK